MTPLLEIKDLVVDVAGKNILKGVSLTIHKNEIHAIMGPNGAGKSSIAGVVAGDPRYTVVSGDIIYQGESILAASPEERVSKGIFLSFQHPIELPGIPLVSLLQASLQAVRKRRKEPPLLDNQVKQIIEETMKQYNALFLREREVNVGCSGGEKKRAELLHMALLQPTLSILDEIDSGLDIDSLKDIATGIRSICAEKSCLLITHYKRLLEYVKPQYIHVMVQGSIVCSDGYSLIHELESEGYARFI
jgi:Fe-S cluster assembly ATP-binding protein